MGFWKSLRRAITRPFTRTSASPPPPAPTPTGGGASGGPDWGDPFPAGQSADALSNDNKEFSWWVAGWKPIKSEREDLEKEPRRALTDAELRRADYLVIHFSGPMGYTTITSGPWEDWEDLWDDVAGYYDEGES